MPPFLIKLQRKFQLTQERNTLILRISINAFVRIRSHNRGRSGKSWDQRALIIWDDFFIFRLNCAILMSYTSGRIHAHVLGSRMDVVMLCVIKW